MVLFFFYPSNAVEFIGGISLLRGDVDTLFRFSSYLFVFLSTNISLLKSQKGPSLWVFNSCTNLRIIGVARGHLSWARDSSSDHDCTPGTFCSGTRLVRGGCVDMLESSQPKSEGKASHPLKSRALFCNLVLTKKSRAQIPVVLSDISFLLASSDQMVGVVRLDCIFTGFLWGPLPVTWSFRLGCPLGLQGLANGKHAGHVLSKFKCDSFYVSVFLVFQFVFSLSS